MTSGNSHHFQRPLTVSCTALTAGKLPAVRAVQGDCERVYYLDIANIGLSMARSQQVTGISILAQWGLHADWDWILARSQCTLCRTGWTVGNTADWYHVLGGNLLVLCHILFCDDYKVQCNLTLFVFVLKQRQKGLNCIVHGSVFAAWFL